MRTYLKSINSIRVYKKRKLRDHRIAKAGDTIKVKRVFGFGKKKIYCEEDMYSQHDDINDFNIAPKSIVGGDGIVFIDDDVYIKDNIHITSEDISHTIYFDTYEDACKYAEELANTFNVKFAYDD